MPISPEYTPIAAVGILLLGIIVGAIAARLVLPSRRQLRRLTSELESLRAEHAAYRANVTRHFETTSDLVANMTASYKAVYDHLSAGAQTLCDGSKVLEAGGFGAPRLVFDSRVDVGGPDADVKHAASESTAATPPTAEAGSDNPTEAKPTRADGPVLEMTKATSTAETATTNDADAHAQEEEESGEATRPSIH